VTGRSTWHARIAGDMGGNLIAEITAPTRAGPDDLHPARF
jgi:hypothetical protein